MSDLVSVATEIMLISPFIEGRRDFHQHSFPEPSDILQFNLQNLFLYGYGAIFNFLAILGIAVFKGNGLILRWYMTRQIIRD